MSLMQIVCFYASVGLSLTLRTSQKKTRVTLEIYGMYLEQNYLTKLDMHWVCFRQLMLWQQLSGLCSQWNYYFL